MSHDVVWLAPPRFTGGLKSLLQNHYLPTVGFLSSDIYYASITTGMLTKKSKNTFTWDESKRHLFEANLHRLINSLDPKVIVINDRASLGFITRKYLSLAMCRGGVYIYNYMGREIPCLVVDDIYKVKSTNSGAWILIQDLYKLRRWSTDAQRHEPKFAYTVCKTRMDLDELTRRATAPTCFAITSDIETGGRGRGSFISCVGYTLWDSSGYVHSWIVPLFDGGNADGGHCFWPDEEHEIHAWQTIQKVNNSPAYKCFQNGTYDNSYFVRYRSPIFNWLFDTTNFMHSLWPESRKKLDFLASLAIDHYQFWKDEGKEDEKDDDLEPTKLPTTPQGQRDYWRYCALDCHNTMLIWRYYSLLITQPSMEWARENYIKEIRAVTGPAFAMTMRGVRVNPEIKDTFFKQNTEKSLNALNDLQIMVDDPDFNPRSPTQVASLIYDTLQASPIPRKKRSTREDVLKLIQAQSLLLDRIIDQIWKVKKPANNASKYGEKLWLWNKRWLYLMNRIGTETGRYASKSHPFWIGTQIQNPPYEIRAMCEPDPGYLFWRIDYAQSDAYFTAFESEDQNFMRVMLSDEDTHCIHAEHFFKIPYEKLYAAHKAHEDWVSHNVTGVRSITKRVVYGANYRMAAYTLFLTMELKAVVTAAKTLGYADADTWDLKKLIKLCEAFLRSYFEFYPELEPALQEAVAQAKSNGNKATCAFGMTRTFLGNLNDDKTQRELAAFLGQGGTAGNINLAIENIYYGNPKLGFESGIDNQNCHILFQIHDDLTGQVRENRLELIQEINKRMANDCHVKGRNFKVPTEIQVGYGWGKRMMDYHDGLTLQEIRNHDNEWKRKHLAD